MKTINKNPHAFAQAMIILFHDILENHRKEAMKLSNYEQLKQGMIDAKIQRDHMNKFIDLHCEQDKKSLIMSHFTMEIIPAMLLIKMSNRNDKMQKMLRGVISPKDLATAITLATDFMITNGIKPLTTAKSLSTVIPLDKFHEDEPLPISRIKFN